jgi:hypothetical protein
MGVLTGRSVCRVVVAGVGPGAGSAGSSRVLVDGSGGGLGMPECGPVGVNELVPGSVAGLLVVLGVDLIVAVAFAAMGPGCPRWSKAPLMFRNELIAVDRLAGQGKAQADDVKRLGNKPVVLEFASDDAHVEVASRAEDRALVTGPMTNPV